MIRQQIHLTRCGDSSNFVINGSFLIMRHSLGLSNNILYIVCMYLIILYNTQYNVVSWMSRETFKLNYERYIKAVWTDFGHSLHSNTFELSCCSLPSYLSNYFCRVGQGHLSRYVATCESVCVCVGGVCKEFLFVLQARFEYFSSKFKNIC